MANGTIGSVMITQQQIEERAAEIARQIEKDFEGQPILLVGILKGAVMWMVDMMKNIQLGDDYRLHGGQQLRFVHQIIRCGQDSERSGYGNRGAERDNSRRYCRFGKDSQLSEVLSL